MAYNNGRENRKWLIWKETEEKILREHGVDETTIEQIRTDDRADFNSNRRFYRWTSKREHERLKRRMKRLLDMRLNNEIEESQFEEKPSQLQEKLAALKESGIITEEEFNQKKAVLLEKL